MLTRDELRDITIANGIETIKQLEAERDALKSNIDGFWDDLGLRYDIESREDLESRAENWNPPNPLLVALHYIWKREPKMGAKDKRIAELEATVERCREVLAKWDHLGGADMTYDSYTSPDREHGADEATDKLLLQLLAILSPAPATGKKKG